ncbi:MAG TPA: histidinol-phosphatase HisJ family protein [Holophaga sp.]|nr:histidinol-phosphatase HisJ family protein [Holophaga sp.]
MSIPCDYHMHSRFSSDGKASQADMCEAALACGLREVCFTEHVDWLPWDESRDYFDPEAYVPAAQACSAAYAGRLVVRMGLEISEPHLVSQRVQDLLAAWPFDFVLGSAHWIDRSGIYLSRLYPIHPAEHVEREYFRRVLELAEAGEFDCLAHLDLVRRYRPPELGPLDALAHAGIIRRILEVVVARDKAIEINTSPLRRGLDATCPDATVLRWYRELGGEKVTIGSDAHSPEQVGTGFDVAREMLRAAGFSRIVRYERRRPVWVNLPD